MIYILIIFSTRNCPCIYIITRKRIIKTYITFQTTFLYYRFLIRIYRFITYFFILIVPHHFTTFYNFFHFVKYPYDSFSKIIDIYLLMDQKDFYSFFLHMRSWKQYFRRVRREHSRLRESLRVPCKKQKLFLLCCFHFFRRSPQSFRAKERKPRPRTTVFSFL